jgi:hypothetical protein
MNTKIVVNRIGRKQPMHKYLPLSIIRKFEPLMKDQGVSVVARSSAGFLTAYKRSSGLANGLSDHWIAKREAFLARHMAQLIANDEPLYGKEKMPARRHLALIAWAYSPDASHLAKLADRL